MFQVYTGALSDLLMKYSVHDSFVDLMWTILFVDVMCLKKYCLCIVWYIFLLAYAEADILGIPPHMIRLDEKYFTYFIYIYIYIYIYYFYSFFHYIISRAILIKTEGKTASFASVKILIFRFKVHYLKHCLKQVNYWDVHTIPEFQYLFCTLFIKKPSKIFSHVFVCFKSHLYYPPIKLCMWLWSPTLNMQKKKV